MTKAILIAKVEKLAVKCNLDESQIKAFVAKIAADNRFK